MDHTSCSCAAKKLMRWAWLKSKYKMALEEPYVVTPLPVFGVQVHGIDLNLDQPQSVIDKIKEDVLKHRFMVFRDQGIVSGQRQVEISKWFGELDSPFYKHPRSPHLDVFRVSNDADEGCTGVGRTGWHVDGSFQNCPYSHSIYHIISVPLKGNTLFVPLNEVVNSLTSLQSQRWERLSMCSDRRDQPSHPLVYEHPQTHKKTLCFHLGMTSGFVWDYGTTSACAAAQDETTQLLSEIHQQIVHTNKDRIYSHKWSYGDFIISDNLAVGHEASPETQLSREEVGLRVMHRTTVKGTHPPAKCS